MYIGDESCDNVVVEISRYKSHARLIQLFNNLSNFAFLTNMAFEKQVSESGSAGAAVDGWHEHNCELCHFVDAMQGENGLKARYTAKERARAHFTRQRSEQGRKSSTADPNQTWNRMK
jgi:hypothetical protein